MLNSFKSITNTLYLSASNIALFSATSGGSAILCKFFEYVARTSLEQKINVVVFYIFTAAAKNTTTQEHVFVILYFVTLSNTN